MPKTRKSRGRAGKNCKTGTVDQYRQPWCAQFLAHALKTADVEAACRLCSVEIGEYLTARRTDPRFELECAELDLVVRAAAVASIEAAAARGEANVGKLKLLMAGLESLRMFSGDGPGQPVNLESLPPYIAEEVRRWLKFKEERPDFSPERYTVKEFCANSEFEDCRAYQAAMISDLRDECRRLTECPLCSGIIDRKCRKCKATGYEMDHVPRPDPDDEGGENG